MLKGVSIAQKVDTRLFNCKSPVTINRLTGHSELFGLQWVISLGDLRSLQDELAQLVGVLLIRAYSLVDPAQLLVAVLAEHIANHVVARHHLCLSQLAAFGKARERESLISGNPNCKICLLDAIIGWITEENHLLLIQIHHLVEQERPAGVASESHWDQFIPGGQKCTAALAAEPLGALESLERNLNHCAINF